MNLLRSFVLLALLVLAPGARAVDGMSLEVGKSDAANASVDMARIGL